MTSLIERCQQANDALAQMETARRTAHVRLQVQERAREWIAQLARLSTTFERAEWAGVSPREVPSFMIKREQLRKNAADALARLRENQDVTQLTADALWTRLLQSVAGAAEAIEETVKTSWQSIVQEQGAFAPPAELEAKLTPTPANRQALANYSSPYATYKRLSGSPMPRNALDRSALETAARLCQEALATVDYDVPAEVADFFRAVNANTATLSCLTPHVLEWLTVNVQLDRYNVRGVSQ